jgi:hypothetical protein
MSLLLYKTRRKKRSPKNYSCNKNQRRPIFCYFVVITVAIGLSVTIIESRICTTLVSLMILDYWGHIKTQVLYEDAKTEFLKETSQEFLVQLTQAPLVERNLVSCAYYELCYNVYTNVLVSVHWVLTGKYWPCYLV